MSRGVAGAGGGQRRGPPHRAGARIERPQAEQRVDHDHVWTRLQNSQLDPAGHGACQALHQATQPPFRRPALLEQPFVRPPLVARHQIVQRDHRRPGGAPPVDEQGAALGQDAAGDDLREAQAPGIEDDGAGHWVKDQQQARARCFHEKRAFDHANAVGRQPAELGPLPGDLAAVDIYARERCVGRDEERARRRDLLPADVPPQPERPRCGRTGRGGRSGLSMGRGADCDDQRERQERATSGDGGHDDPLVNGRPYIPPAGAGAQGTRVRLLPFFVSSPPSPPPPARRRPARDRDRRSSPGTSRRRRSR